jgi:hypothetical protein
MRSKKLLPNSLAFIKDISQAIEYALEKDMRCIVPYTMYNNWDTGILALLETQGILRKEKSQKLSAVRCKCEYGESLPIEYAPDTPPFVQCFHCGIIRDVSLPELEYYEASPLTMACFLTKCLNGIDKPKPLLKDNVMVYFVCGLKSCDAKGILEKCNKDASGRNFIVISTFIPEDLAKRYILIPAYEGRLYILDNNALGLALEFLENFFLKNSQKQEAAFAKHSADPRVKQNQHLQEHIKEHIDSWPQLNHEEIHQKICDEPILYEYETKKGEVKKLSDKTILKVIKALLTERNQRFRITGTQEYNSDRHTWYNS